MTRLVAVAVVLVLPAAGRADMGMPWPLQHHVPVRITVHPTDPPPGVALFVETYPGGLRRLPRDTPLVVESGRNGGGASFTIYSVPTAVLERMGVETPPRDRFNYANRDATRVGGGTAKGQLDFTDGRGEVVLEYRLVRRGDGVDLVKVSENVGSKWFGVACCFSGFAAPAGIVWLGMWAARRWFRARPRPAA